jgi:hypothetical protein
MRALESERGTLRTELDALYESWSALAESEESA